MPELGADVRRVLPGGEVGLSRRLLSVNESGPRWRANVTGALGHQPRVNEVNDVTQTIFNQLGGAKIAALQVHR
jgi:hypothetical protein